MAGYTFWQARTSGWHNVHWSISDSAVTSCGRPITQMIDPTFETKAWDKIPADLRCTDCEAWAATIPA
jgi:hypothetical protein